MRKVTLNLNTADILEAPSFRDIVVEFPFYIFDEFTNSSQMFDFYGASKNEMFKKIIAYEDSVLCFSISENDMIADYHSINYSNNLNETKKIDAQLFREQFRRTQNYINSYIKNSNERPLNVDSLTLPQFLHTTHNQYLFISNETNKDNRFTGVIVENESFFSSDWSIDKIYGEMTHSKFISKDEFVFALAESYLKLMELIYR